MKTIKKLCRLVFLPLLGLFATSLAFAEMPEKIKQEGTSLIEEGKFKEAFEVTLPFAKNGDADAQFALGVILLADEIELPKEYIGLSRSRIALCWIEYAAIQGNVEACLLLSQSYEKGFNGVTKNTDMSVFWKKKAGKKMSRRGQVK